MEYYIGLMSGTSMDGVDAALVALDLSEKTLSLVDAIEFPLSETLKQDLISLGLGQKTTLAQIGELDHRLGLLFAEATLALLAHSSFDASQVTAIGCHGQTVFHQPHGEFPFTLQLGDGNVIAVKTGIHTINDFRRKDMALGGQGAPLVPAFHQWVFNVQDTPQVVLNIGGIANITVLSPKGEVNGYDTGAGNMLMDAWIAQHQDVSFDCNGDWAAQGNVNSALLATLLADPYFAQLPPKSTGRERFNLDWLAKQLEQHPFISPVDVQATLAAFTADSIINDVKPLMASRLLVCGGGARNKHLMTQLQEGLPSTSVTTTAEDGVDPDNLEAMAFAWLAARTWHRQSGNLPVVTGASQSAILGALHWAD
jgi:anhydro-N-acetylmuramic acid kinase